MMVFKTLLPAAGISVLAALPCLAQTAAPAPALSNPAPLVSVGKKLQVIAVRFVRPSLMAHWLDPSHNPLPRELGLDAEASAGVRFVLPEGVDRVVAVDPQGALLVLGTAAGVEKLRERVAGLDKPQRRIALDARLITIQSDKLSGVWADVAARTGSGVPAMAVLKPGDELRLGEQFLQLQARIESVRSLTVATGAAQTLDFAPPAPTPSTPSWARDFSYPMPVIPPPASGDIRNLGSGGRKSPAPSPLDQIRLHIAPTLQNGNLVTLNLSFPLGQTPETRATELSASLNEGETLALALPATSTRNRAFLLLAAREIPHLEIAVSGLP